MSALDDPFGFDKKKKRKQFSKTQKERIARGQKWKCGRCQQKIEPLSYDIHHRDGDALNDSFSNLVALCVKCHREVTQKQNKYKAKKKKNQSDLGDLNLRI